MRVIVAAVVALLAGVRLGAQSPDRRNLDGPRLYDAACAACHGADGRGQPLAQRGFAIEPPDFTDCRLTTPEANLDWYSVIHQGGPVRAFDAMMPAFGDELTPDEIGTLIERLREFCGERGWPHGDLNMPRPFVTEKAFPENEAVVTTTVSRGDEPRMSSVFLYERRLGRRGQYEIFARDKDEIGGAYKHVLFASHDSGSIVAAGGEVKAAKGDGAFEAFASASQTIPFVRDGFLHVHVGVEAPAGRSSSPKEAFWRVAVGRTYTEHMWGRSWSPMVELLAARELDSGARNEWDALPQLQISLSRRQHVLLNAGVRVPLTRRDERPTSVLLYLLWDWFDGGFLTGW